MGGRRLTGAMVPRFARSVGETPTLSSDFVLTVLTLLKLPVTF